MPAPYSNLRSKLDRAIAAYLIAQGVNGGVNIFPWAYGTTATYPNFKVHSVLSKPEPDFSGNRRVTVHIEIRGQNLKPATGQPTEAPRVAFDALVASAADALMQSSTNGIDLAATAQAIQTAGRNLAGGPDAANNADMVDFSVLLWLDIGEGEGQMDPDEEGCSWCEILIFEALACPANVS